MGAIGMLVGRAKEVGALAEVLSAVRDGLSAVLVLRGECGTGKTALLDWATRAAGEMRVARAAAVESEMDLGFAGLHQLLVPFLGEVGRLPPPQRDALQAAFGLAVGPPPDRFLVGLATLTLLTEAASSRPVLCVVDNAQWLDQASAEVLGFVARRLFADRVVMLFAVLEGEDRSIALHGLPELQIGGLAEGAAHELLAAVASGPVDHRVSERIVAETGGNPLGLVEFGRELTADECSRAVPLTGPLRFGGRLEELYRSRVRALPADTRTLLLVLAADQLGDTAKVWQAAGRLGVGPRAMEPPAVERIVTGMPLRFRHPMLRSIVYYGAPGVARGRVHEALAAVRDPVRDPDRRAWHLAQSRSGLDEEVARELERSADRARARGGWGSSAAFLERSAELTADRGRRAGRLVSAAEARLMTGETSAARALLDAATPRLTDPVERARARRLEGEILFAAGDAAVATSVLLEAARMVTPHDARVARDTLLEALAAQLSSRQAAGNTDVVQAIQSAPRITESAVTTVDLLLDGFAALAEGRFEPAATALRQAVDSVTGGQPLPADAPRRFLAFRLAASELYDDRAWRELAGQWVARGRDEGALAATVVGLGFQASSQLAEGRFAAAEASLTEARTLAEAMGNRAYVAGLAEVEVEVLAWRGDQAGARVLAGQLLRARAERSGERAKHRVHKAMAALELGLANYAEALRHALAAAADQPILTYPAGPDLLIEAAVRCADRTAAAVALDAAAPWWQACGTPWSLGLLARAQALLADDEQAEEDGYRRSIEHLRQCRITPELARSHLLYGEWLRRRRRRRGAREQLRVACELFESIGMGAFAQRAGAELRAVGEQAAGPRDRAPDALTAQEAQIARLAANGATNQEIAAKLFISASTVDYHLRKIFRKLKVSRRVQLPNALSAVDEH
jgi:DNA-binding CsgD family transcriptional regulator/tetratricopeptide (TPR) repeat protein